MDGEWTCGCEVVINNDSVGGYVVRFNKCPLHAAAPEMLEELKVAVSWLYGHHNEGQEKCRQRIEALITKVTGPNG